MAVTDVCVILLQESYTINQRDWVETAQAVGLCEERGFHVEGCMVRTEAQRQYVAQRLVERPPRLAVLIVNRGQSPTALGLLNEMKQISPRCCVAIAGAEGTLNSHDFTNHTVPGAILLGEWVEATAELITALKKHRPGSEVPGTWWRSDKGWALGPRRTYNPSLGSWPRPNPEGLKPMEWSRTRGARLPILASRGFPFQSLFTDQPMIRALQDTASYYHMRPVARVVEEAVKLASTYKLKAIDFADDIFPWDPAWTSEFVSLWVDQVGLPFRIRTIGEHLDHERLSVLKQGGMQGIEICMESGNEPLRHRHSDVNVHNAQVREALALCKALGIRTHVRLLLGTPGESLKTLESTIAFARASGATSVVGELHKPLPENPQWDQLELEMTGASGSRPSAQVSPEIYRDAAAALNEIQKINSLAKALRVVRREDAALDGMSDIASARVRSPLEGPFCIDTFHGNAGSQDVIALRVPCQLTWPVKLPKDPIVHFGILLEPALPGERSRHPVSFSVRVSQAGRSYRLFQKVLIQALDPDSRLWHWFRLPITNVRSGWADLTFENLIFGHDASFIPPGRDIWAGWARIYVSTAGAIISNDESTDHDFESAEHTGIEGLFGGE
ncbi:hypothetical protein GC173_00455 [bacterium]|nr:hypothetical protein [bacterium]